MSKRKNTQKATPMGQKAPATPKKLIDLTEPELEQVQGGLDPGTGLPSGHRMHPPYTP